LLPAEPFDVLPEHNVYHVFASWYPSERVASLLLVVDVSGSMGDTPPGSGRPLMSLVRSSCRRVARLLPDEASLGLWKFGSRLPEARGRDYESLTGLARLTDRQRHRYRAAVDRLRPERTGTGLYDSILAGFRYAKKHYRAHIPNTVMVVTDGRNEDDPHSISLGSLTATLKAEAEADRPVSITVAALGDKPDADALDRVVAPLSGRVVRVYSADELGAMFVHVAAGAE
jgi:hypothetical protein